GASDGKLYARNAVSGASVWTATTGGAISSSPTVAGSAVYVGSVDRKLYAFNAGTGAQLWSSPTPGPVASSPAYVGGTLYAGSDDATYAQTVVASGGLFGEPTASVVAGGVIYVANVGIATTSPPGVVRV